MKYWLTGLAGVLCSCAPVSARGSCAASDLEPPQLTRRVKPNYPDQARVDGVEGYVTIDALVGHTGRVEEMALAEAEPPGIFEDSAAYAIQQWRFEPAKCRGTEVALWVRQTVRYELGPAR